RRRTSGTVDRLSSPETCSPGCGSDRGREAQLAHRKATGRTAPYSANRRAASGRLSRRPCRTRGKKRDEFAGGGAGAAPSARQDWHPTAVTSPQAGRDETITFAGLRETRG